RHVSVMSRRLGGDDSLTAPMRDDGESGEWQDWLVDEAPSQERILAESEESDNRHKALVSALDVLNERERRIFEARRLADDPITLEELAAEFGVSRERVRQIEMRAFVKVQRTVKVRVAMEQTKHYPVEIVEAGPETNRGGLHLPSRRQRYRDGISSKSHFSFLNSNLLAPRSSLHISHVE